VIVASEGPRTPTKAELRDLRRPGHLEACGGPAAGGGGRPVGAGEQESERAGRMDGRREDYERQPELQ